MKYLYANGFPYFRLKTGVLSSRSRTTISPAMIFYLYNCRWLNTKSIGPWLIIPVLVYYKDINPLLTGMRRENINQIETRNYTHKWITMTLQWPFLHFLRQPFFILQYNNSISQHVVLLWNESEEYFCIQLKFYHSVIITCV